MIVLNVKIETNPAPPPRLKDAVAAMEKASRAETGCIEYVFSTELNNPTNIRIIEHWKDIDSLKNHFTMPHMATFNEAMQKASAERRGRKDVRRDADAVSTAVVGGHVTLTRRNGRGRGNAVRRRARCP